MERKDNLGDKKWNNQANDRLDHKIFNEGFSAENLPPDYNATDDNSDNFRKEMETDEDGNREFTERARHIDDEATEISSDTAIDEDNRVIENQRSLQNRDMNYDIDPERYPPSHPDNHIHRGNIEEE